MPTRVLICDDSSFAQKQMARALPEDWDIELAFASNGILALQALNEGKGEILFLDLNMPDMDGYQVLEAIQQQKLATKVIVVSGDVQPDAYRRVVALGALEFIKKPIDREAIIHLLEKLQLRQIAGERRDSPVDLIVDVYDGYQEIANIAMGRAAEMLAKLLDCFVVMPIPKVNAIEVTELCMLMQQLGKGERVSAVCQGFIGSGIAGEALLIFNESSFKDIAELMRFEGEIDEVVQLELLMDIASILIGACLKGIADQLDISFSQSHPIVLGQHVKIDDLLKRGVGRWKKTLTIELGYSIENRNINSDLLLLITEDSLPRFSELVSYVME